MPYALNDLLKLRERREDTREQELQKAREHQRQMEEAYRQAKQRSDDFEKTRPEKIEHLYRAVLGQVVQRERLDRLKEAVAAIDAEALTLRRNAEEALRRSEEAAAAAETARAAYQMAVKNVVKLETHRDAWKQEAAVEEERNEEREQEDFIPLSLRADDDDSTD